MANNTKARKGVMDILKNQSKPISAKDILKELYNQDITVCLSTVYRILSKFEEEKILVKSYLKDSNNKFFELVNDEHKHYAICLMCDNMAGISVCPVNSIKGNIKESLSFEVTGHKLEIYGYCKDCNVNKT
jgi:Fur family transcriptional regulator, ferric uptake regulator